MKTRYKDRIQSIIHESEPGQRKRPLLRKKKIKVLLMSHGDIGIPEANVLNLKRTNHLFSNQAEERKTEIKDDPIAKKREIEQQELLKELLRSTREDFKLDEKFSSPLKEEQDIESEKKDEENDGEDFFVIGSEESSPGPVFESIQKFFSFGKIRHPHIRSILIFAALSFALLGPLIAYSTFDKVFKTKNRVLGLSDQAIDELRAASFFAEDAEWDLASSQFQKASQTFESAENTIRDLGFVLNGIASFVPLKGKEFKSGQHLLAAGKELSQAGLYVSQALKPWVDLDLELLSDESFVDPIGLTTLIQLSNDQLKPAHSALVRANSEITAVNFSFIPKEKQKIFQDIRQSLPELIRGLNALFGFSEQLLLLLGEHENRRYVFLFQNDDEMRATGGFISGFGLVDISKGRVKKMDIPSGGTYDLKGGLTERVQSPIPLRLVNPHWNAQDANWWPDFPTSAKKFLWFYEHSGGPSVDGVIALTPTLIEQLLAQTGPIDMTGQYGEWIGVENFRKFANEQSKAFRGVEAGTPKQFIADFAPQFLNRIFSGRQENILEMFKILSRGLTEKHLLIALTDPDEQKNLDPFGWSGVLTASPQDYVSVVNTNIAGGPTDRAITTNLDYRVDVQDDGRLISTLIIQRIHHGGNRDDEEQLKNIDYVRIYVPKGSRLLAAKGFEQPGQGAFIPPEQGFERDKDVLDVETNRTIHEQSKTEIVESFEKTVFANWMQVEPYDQAIASIQYELPFRLASLDRYLLVFQKQPGAKSDPLAVTIAYPSNRNVLKVIPEEQVSVSTTQAKLQRPLNQDIVFGLVFDRKK